MSGLTERWFAVPAQRRKRFVLVGVALCLVGVVIWRARIVLSPFLFGLGLAYLLAPVVKLMERGWLWVGRWRRLRFFGRAARPLSLVLSYILVIAALVGISALIVPVVVKQGESLWAERERVWDYLAGMGDDILEQYRLLPPQVQTQIDDTLTRFSSELGTVVQQTLSGTAIAISYTVTLLLAVLLIPFWSFFLLLDSGKIGHAAVRTVPRSIREDVLKIVTLADKAFGSYLRGQLFLALLIGSISGIAFSIMGVRFAVFLGLVAGIFELIPNIGPWLGAIPAVLVALTQQPILALWVMIYAATIQQIESIFIAPRVIGSSVKLHPVVVMVVLIIGSELGGVLGLFLAPVVTAVLRDTFRYLYYRVGETPLSPEEALRKVWRVEEFDLEV